MNLRSTLTLDGIYERTGTGQRALVFEDPSYSDEELRILSLFTGETPLVVFKDLLAGQGDTLEAVLPKLLDAGLVRARQPGRSLAQDVVH